MGFCHKWCGVTFAILVTGITLFVAGFATENWSQMEGSRRGLWRKCITYDDQEHCSNFNITKPQWMVWCRALGCLTIFALVGSLTHYVCTSCCNMCARKCMLIWQIILIIGSATCVITTVAVYVSHYHQDLDTENYKLGYSFYLTCISAAFFILAAIFAAVDMFTSESYEVTHTRLE